MDPVENLRAAADLIEPEGAWCQRNYARDEYRHPVDVMSPHAVCFCANGAIKRTANGNAAETISTFRRFVHHKFGHQYFETTNWNDAPKRTQKQVVYALRECADELEREEG